MASAASQTETNALPFKRGDKVIYSGPFVNFHGECTFLCEAGDDGLAVLRHHGGSIESVYVNTSNLVLA